MNLQTPLSRAKGLGAAKEGVSHWWIQRLTAVALIPLILWFCFAIASLPDMQYTTLLAWLQTPTVAVLLVLLIPFTLYHAHLGLQVVIEDYVHNHGIRTSLIIAVGLLAVLLAVSGIFSVLRIFFGS